MGSDAATADVVAIVTTPVTDADADAIAVVCLYGSWS